MNKEKIKSLIIFVLIVIIIIISIFAIKNSKKVNSIQDNDNDNICSYVILKQKHSFAACKSKSIFVFDKNNMVCGVVTINKFPDENTYLECKKELENSNSDSMKFSFDDEELTMIEMFTRLEEKLNRDEYVNDIKSSELTMEETESIEVY